MSFVATRHLRSVVRYSGNELRCKVNQLFFTVNGCKNFLPREQGYTEDTILTDVLTMLGTLL